MPNGGKLVLGFDYTRTHTGRSICEGLFQRDCFTFWRFKIGRLRIDLEVDSQDL